MLDSKIGRLVLAEFSDPDRLARLGTARFRAFTAKRDVRCSVTLAERLVAAARNALPTPEAATARQVVAADLALLADLDVQIAEAQARIAALVPATVYGMLTTAPGWGTLRAGTYAAAVGDPARWPSHAQIYRASGLTPAQYELAGRRRDGGISREGSVGLRIASSTSASTCGTRKPPPAPTLLACASAASPAALAVAHSPDARTRSPTPWCATRPSTTSPAGRSRTNQRVFPTAAGCARLAGKEGRIRRRPGCDAPPRRG